MVAKGNIFSKYLWLLRTIYEAGEISFSDINKRYKEKYDIPDVDAEIDFDSRGKKIYKDNGLSLRTFHNQKNALEEMFDINIECNKRDGYKYYIEESDDINNGLTKWILSLFSLKEIADGKSRFKERILYENESKSLDHLPRFVKAIKENKVMRITYAPYDQKSFTTEVQPYFLKKFKQIWYAVCNTGAPDLHVFALDRITVAEITDMVFSYPADFNPEGFYTDCYGIINVPGVKPQTIKYKVYGKQVHYIDALPLHHSQKKISEHKSDNESESYAVYTCFVEPVFDFKQELMAMGSLVEVLEPASFRQEMQSEAGKLCAMYGGRRGL